MVRGCVLADIRAFPSRLAYGACSLGQVCSNVVVFQSASGTAFTVGPSKENPRGVVINRIPRKDGSKRFRISFEAAKLGYVKMPVSFDVQSVAGNRTTLVILMKYVGIEKLHNTAEEK